MKMMGSLKPRFLEEGPSRTGTLRGVCYQLVLGCLGGWGGCSAVISGSARRSRKMGPTVAIGMKGHGWSDASRKQLNRKE